MNAINFNFITNNVKGLQSSKKRLKLFEYFRDKLSSNGILFLQETHSTINNELKWRDEFKGSLHFSHGKSNSCGVLIGYLGNKPFNVINEFSDKNGRILILEVDFDDCEYLLINLYNANTEKEQLVTLNDLDALLSKIDCLQSKRIIFAGDFNVIFDRRLDAKGGNPILKKNSISKLIKLKEDLDLCDIWRIHNPKMKSYTFRQQHCSGLIQRRLDYIFLSVSFQELIKKSEILNAFSTDHSPVFCSIENISHFKKGSGLWKFNNSLLHNEEFVRKFKEYLEKTKDELNRDPELNKQMKWELLKYKIRYFTILFSKGFAKKKRLERELLESELKALQEDLNCENNLEKYNICKAKLEEIYDNIAEGIKVRTKTQWYEEGEKSSKFFLNLEKTKASRGVIKKLCIDEHTECKDQIKINKEIEKFYRNLFKKGIKKSLTEMKAMLDKISIPTLKEEHIHKCDKEITEKELLNVIKSFSNNKSPGNDGLTKELYEFFWNDLKQPFMDAIKETKMRNKLITSQRQAVIKLVEKKDKDKRFIKNWRPISLLNVDYKIISKVFALRVKEVLSDLISSQQTAYVPFRCISESGRLISDVIEMAELLKLRVYLVTIDIEKAFDSLDHTFLEAVLEKSGFGKYFIDWIKIFLKEQESCVINGGVTSQYFKLERGARQGDPISAYLFIICLEVLFILVKENDKINGLDIFDNKYLYTAYADDTTFFLKDLCSIRELVKAINYFSTFSGLKPNISKCEVAGIGVLKGVKVAICGFQCVNLKNNAIKILGIYFSYDKNIQFENNFKKIVTNIMSVLKMWKSRNLTLEGKILVFKTLALSKLVYVAQVIHVSDSIIDKIKEIQKDF